MRAILLALVGLFPALVVPLSVAETVIEDGGISMSREEIQFIVDNWPDQMQKAGATDIGDRIELLNRALVDKKLAAEAEGMKAQADSELYWRHVFAVRNTQRDFVTQAFMATVEAPDMSALAEELYVTQKDKFALAPETRQASHILLRCAPPRCNRVERRKDAEAILQQINSGEATFEEMVERYSEDPGSKLKGGQVSTWMRKGEPNVAPGFVGGAFDIEEIGGISGIVETRFGYHIMKLDGIRESYYKSFEEVRDNIVASLEGEYLKLSGKAFNDGYRLSDDAKIDMDVLDEIFEPYTN